MTRGPAAARSRATAISTSGPITRVSSCVGIMTQGATGGGAEGEDEAAAAEEEGREGRVGASGPSAPRRASTPPYRTRRPTPVLAPESGAGFEVFVGTPTPLCSSFQSWDLPRAPLNPQRTSWVSLGALVLDRPWVAVACRVDTPAAPSRSRTGPTEPAVAPKPTRRGGGWSGVRRYAKYSREV